MNKYAVLMESAISYRLCLLGEGDSPESALVNAYGPKPWPKSARKCIVREVTLDELEELRNAEGGAE